jgi:hypothetical protein
MIEIEDLTLDEDSTVDDAEVRVRHDNAVWEVTGLSYEEDGDILYIEVGARLDHPT